jgi:16S rRNA (cytosine1402-N4)-methyltransferase
VWERAVGSAIEVLAPGGRIAVLSYHSLEDRITKQLFTRLARVSPDVPPDLPVVPEEHQPLLRLLTRGAETADETEVADNPRARSVRVRAAERVREGAVA